MHHKLRMALLGSVSLVAVTAVTIDHAAWAQSVSTIVKSGTAGANNTTGFSSVDATAGGDAGPVSETVMGMFSNTTTPAILFQSIGGNGGVGTPLFFESEPGANGGNGGAVTLTDMAAISGGQNQTKATQLIDLLSQGGMGGQGTGGFGRGGDGGPVSLDLYGNTLASGNYVGAIRLQSIGGSVGTVENGTTDPSNRAIQTGGNGGDTTLQIEPSVTVSTSGNNAPAIVLRSKGGNGGTPNGHTKSSATNGGAGGYVFISNQGAVTTSGDNSTAIFLEGEGGRGGNGFVNGNDAANGGVGGRLDAGNLGTITTSGNYSLGLVAVSTGGKGGDGGSAAAGSAGNGGNAGNGGSVKVAQFGAITTTGTGSIGIVAESVAGGDALDAFQYTTPVGRAVTAGGSGGRNNFIAQAGEGGSGGNGGTVTVTDNAGSSITTAGQNAYGILAQSIGGGGGQGGVSNTAGFIFGLSRAGAGGGGGNGGSVTVKTVAGSSIATSGTNAAGIIALSAGGGGGAGGSASLTVVGVKFSVATALGGAGGKGGSGGTVAVTNNGKVTTTGSNAAGIVALSVGGGGGIGGNASSVNVTLPLVDPTTASNSIPNVNVTSTVGGTGGDGGNGGTVSVVNGTSASSGIITTTGVGSDGILAQSIGGGGGDGGNAQAYTMNASVQSPTVSVSTTVGGTGGLGGNGGTVSVQNGQAIVTTGADSYGIEAQSIGGGGGNGGSASTTSDTITPKNSVTVVTSVGGKGGGAGTGGSVTVTTTGAGSVTTSGDDSDAILAQSIGGGGGTGGASRASTGTVSFDKTLAGLSSDLPLGDSLAITTSIGGSGGSSTQPGGTVTVNNAANLLTSGQNANGIEAESIGGGGGAAGSSTGSATQTLDITGYIGGSGGSGSMGGTVNVTNGTASATAQPTISTTGDGANGILAQSIGGGGGQGGSVTADTTSPSDKVGALWTQLKASVTPTALTEFLATEQGKDTKTLVSDFLKDVQKTDTYKNLSTQFKNSSFYKEASAEIISLKTTAANYVKDVQTGNVKLPKLTLSGAVGGNGGSGNVGGTVTVTNYGKIATTGSEANGIEAQSVGGGGGAGGTATSAATNDTTLTAVVGGLGGNAKPSSTGAGSTTTSTTGGGTSDTGGTVNVTNAGQITTEGEQSDGILAMSTGGGGGLGVGGVDSNAAKKLSLNVTVGGNAGSGNAGGAVTVVNSGSIRTSGTESYGIVAQSVGGGGGIFNVNPSDTAIGGSATIEDELISALGLDDQIAAISGAGGTGTTKAESAVSMTLGGQGGFGGNGGNLTVTDSGAISTTGDLAFGVVAQSVGDGGGIANDPVAASTAHFTFGNGNTGGSAGNGGSVNFTLANTGSIQTTGDGAIGAFLQSVGGGGGLSSAPLVQNVSLTFAKLANGNSGNGGDIVATMAQGSSISTTGQNADGVLAQSVGGGGGVLATDTSDNLPIVASGSAQGSAKGGLVTLAVQGAISATGANSYGILAQSGQQTSNGGIVIPGAVSYIDNSYSAGFRSTTLTPTSQNGDITVTVGNGSIGSGSVIGGSGDGAGIRIDGGYHNVVLVNPNATVSALSGNAVMGGAGQEWVDNWGNITGNIDLNDTGTANAINFVNNQSSGIFTTAQNGIVNVGSKGLFTNLGNFNVGGTGTIGNTAITGNFTNNGTISVDEDFAQKVGDTLSVSGAALLGGTINVNLIDLPTTFAADNMPVVSLLSAGNIQNSASVAPSVVLTYRLAATASNAVGVQVASANFMPASVSSLPGATDNVQSVASILQSAWDAGNLGDLTSYYVQLARITNPTSYAEELSQVAPEQASVPAASTPLSATNFQNTLHSCPVFVEDTTLLNEQDCVYLRSIGSVANLSTDHGYSGFHSSSYAIELGGEKEVGPGWFLGGAIAPGQGWTSDSSGNSKSNSDTLDLGLVIKHFVTPHLLVAASLSYGNDSSTQTDYDPYEMTIATASQQLNRMTARLREEYDIPFRSWYLRPMVDTDVTYVHMSPYTEGGAGSLDINYKAADKTTPAFSPTLEVGKRIDGRQFIGRLYADIGMTWYVDPTWQQEGSFVGLPGYTFQTSSTIPALVGKFSVGAQIYAWHGVALQAEYDGTYAPSYTENSGTLRMDYRF